MSDIIINLHDKDARVDKDEYITAKHLDLVENFHSLTRAHVAEIVEGILSGKQFDGIIQTYIMDDKPRPVK